MQPIFLIGFMCSGKTTLGQALSVRLGIEFIDLDHYIEQAAGMTVSRIFDEMGEPYFRALEHQALEQISQRDDVIVACGGGTPCQPGAMELMNSRGLTVRLVPDEKRLVRRLMAGRRKRPLIAAIEDAAEMRDFLVFTLAKREPYYCKAKHRFDSTLLESDDDVAATVDRFIHQFMS